MAAPDKVFISSDSLGFMSAYYIENHPPYGEEYIRKDALLEWAKEQQRKWEECINTSKKLPELKKSWATYSGAKIQTEALIDKLNSL